MELTDHRKLQLLEVSLLQRFQKICEENNLNYYFAGGGLIGALRHGGFVPWDDDMDIVMLRDDYDKFIEICKKGLDDGYGLIHYDTDIDPTWNTLYSMFVDKESVIERPTEFESYKSFVWIDILPVDGMPKSRLGRWLHMNHILLLRYWLVLTDIEHRATPKSRPFYERWILSFFKVIPIFKVFNTRKVALKLEKCMHKYHLNYSDYCCDFMGKYRFKEIQPTKRWGNPQTLLFEGIEVKVPEQYHEFLTYIYGDYMQLPPERERKAHNVKLLKCRNVDFGLLEEKSKLSRK